MADKSKLSDRQVEQKAYELWCKAGRPQGEYPRYEKAVRVWDRKGLSHGEFEKYLKTRYESLRDFLTSIFKQTAWSWLTALFIPACAVLIVFHEVNENRKAVEIEIRANREALQQTFEVQNAQNRQQILNDYISQMTTLITEHDLTSKYQKGSTGNYSSEGEKHPDAIVASALTKSTLALLQDEGENTENKSNNDERGALLRFLYSNQLILGSKPILDLSGVDLSRAALWGAALIKADLSGADLSRADLRGADLRGAVLSRAVLRGANLWGVDLREADLWGAFLWGADLSGADLSGADLTAAFLYEANLNSIKWNSETKWPSIDAFGGAKNIPQELRTILGLPAPAEEESP